MSISISFSPESFQLLSTVGVIAASFAVLIGAYRLLAVQSAERTLVRKMSELARSKHLINKFEALRIAIENEQSLDSKTQKELVHLIEESLKQLRGKQRRIVLHGMEQPSIEGRERYQRKLLSLLVN